MLDMLDVIKRIDLAALARRHPFAAAAAAIGAGAIVALHHKYTTTPEVDRGRIRPFVVGVVARAGKAAFGELVAEGYQQWRRTAA
jgi:hypothetical protein